MKVWITKYALTRGVFTVEATTCEDSGSPDMVKVTKTRPPAYYHSEGRDWHRSRESAIARVRQLVAAEVARLRKRIALLETTTIEVL